MLQQILLTVRIHNTTQGMGQVVTETAEIPHKKTKKSITIWVLSGISLAYIGIVYLLIKETETCKNVAISTNLFKGFWDQYLGCRSVNELGDTLAGAFAPVAFLWLMGAVFIQSQELKAQREELDETQEVMRAQLKTSIEQVTETKKSTALIEAQTNLLSEERDRLLEEKRDRILEAKIEALRIFLLRVNDLTLEKRSPKTSDWEFVELAPNAHESTTIDAVVSALMLSIARMLPSIRKSALISEPNATSHPYRIRKGAIDQICQYMQVIVDEFPLASEEMAVRVGSLKLDSMIARLNELKDLLPARI